MKVRRNFVVVRKRLSFDGSDTGDRLDERSEKGKRKENGMEK